VALVNDVILGALECTLRKPQLAYIGPTFTQAKRVAWTYLKDYSEPYWAKTPSESELKVTLKGDRTVYCLGADNADSLRGMYLDGGVGDEYALWRPSVFPVIIRPALSDRNGWWVYSSTPKGKNLFHQIHTQAEKDPDNYFTMTLRASESGIIPARELDDLRRDMDPEEYAQEYECSFDAAFKGAIYADEINQLFEDARLGRDIYNPAIPVHVVYDLGFTDATVAIWYQFPQDGSIDVVHVHATTGSDIFYHIEQIQQFPGEVGDVWLPHDAKARNLQTGRSVVEQFLSEQIRPKIVPSHKVRDRIAATRRMFNRVRIDEASTGDLIEALKCYRREWNEDLMMFMDRPVHDWSSHFADAFGYMCVVAQPADDKRNPTKVISRKLGPGEYNLNTLFQDHARRLSQRRIM
jgi:phage terminase large subunit